MAEPDAAAIYGEAFDQGLRPDPPLTVSEWADHHRRLSGRAAAEPGPWRTARTPYLREIMDCLSPSSPVERVVVMKGAQIGVSECGNNWIGYVIHHAPGPMLAVLPTVEMAKRNSKQRIEPLIEESPALRDRVKPARSRDSGNTVLAKEFPGGVLAMTGANSAVGLPRSTYYDVPAIPADEAEIVARIKTIREEFETYDYRRVGAALRHQGVVVNGKKVRRLMREHDLRPRRRRRFVATTDSDHNGPIFPNLAKDAASTGPNQLWVADITYVAVAVGFVYVAVVLDAWSRRVVGYAISQSIDARLALAALKAATRSRRPSAGCIHHSDRGSQYASAAYRKLSPDTGWSARWAGAATRMTMPRPRAS